MGKIRVIKGKRRRVVRRDQVIEIPQTVINRDTGEALVRVQRIEIKAGVYKSKLREPCPVCGAGMTFIEEHQIRGCPVCIPRALASMPGL